MRGRTGAATLGLLAIVASALGWMLDTWLAGSGRPILTPPLTLPITLVVVAVVVLVLAWPVRRYTRALRAQVEAEREREAHDDAREHGRDEPPAPGSDAETRAPRVDPARAVRVLALAKASSHAAALMGGFVLGVLAFVMTRPVVVDALVRDVVLAVAGAAVLLVAGLVAESWCALPPGADGRRTATSSRPVLGN